MNQVIKSFLGVFLILFLGATCIGIFSLFLQVIRAQDFEAEVVRELEDSDFYSQVAKECFEEAEEQGYSMEIVFYENGASALTVTEASEVPADLSAVDSAKVDLEFDMGVPLFAISESRKLSAHAG